MIHFDRDLKPEDPFLLEKAREVCNLKALFLRKQGGKSVEALCAQRYYDNFGDISQSLCLLPVGRCPGIHCGGKALGNTVKTMQSELIAKGGNEGIRFWARTE